MFERLFRTEKLIKTEPWKPLGIALLDYHLGKPEAALLVRCSVERDRYINLNNFYREDLLFNGIESEALKYCKGKVLDIGAGAGAHALWLQNEGLDVTALDISAEAAEVMKQRGVKKTFSGDFFSISSSLTEKFDTLLFMMNGIGIGGGLNELRRLFQHAGSLLNPEGQIIFDSTDLEYVNQDDKLGASLHYPRPEYYGTVYYQLRYGTYEGASYAWGFYDMETVKKTAGEEGYVFELLAEEQEHYLGRLKFKI